MDYLQSFAISAAGLAAERARVDAAALNLANAHTALAPGAAAYQPLRAVVHAGAPTPFAARVASGLETALPAVTLEPTGAAPRQVLEPGHPWADAQGLVAYPGVDHASEMFTLMSASRAYEANLAALNTARALALKTLDIGRGT